MLEKLGKIINNNSLCILGFGREGQSTYHTIRKLAKDKTIAISDKDDSLVKSLDFLQSDPHVEFLGGPDHQAKLHVYDIIFKTPGLTLKNINDHSLLPRITSQAEVFIEEYRERIIGITGTKGKSTTASLVHHILTNAGVPSLLVGNIGIPPFESIDSINEDTKIVYELSSHQLEALRVSPHLAVILNFFQDHLDHYHSYKDYIDAKMNITKFQTSDDLLFCFKSNKELLKRMQGDDFLPRKVLVCEQKTSGCSAYIENDYFVLKSDSDYYVPISDIILKGKHNLMNCLVASLICKTLDVDESEIVSALKTFKGLRHRMEYMGNYGGVDFYNDSIATIPQASIEAIKTLGNVDFLILGGYDRGLDYMYFASFLSRTRIKNILCIGKAGERVYDELIRLHGSPLVKIFNYYSDIFEYIKTRSENGDVCLLSPAASSYDAFRNFEERGDYFTSLAKSLEV